MRRLSILLLLCLAPCVQAFSVTVPDIVPAPREITMARGRLRIKGININADTALDTMSLKAVRQFADRLSLVSGKTSSVATPIGLARTVSKGDISGMYFLKDASLSPEAYSIAVSGRAVVVRSSSYNGTLYALQTLRQMLPVQVYGTAQAPDADWSLPRCTINDEPRFAYRGMLLDCSRHFFGVDVVKKYLDIMAVYKLNRFHWHLTDDQGWRIEIRKYPRLTEVGAFRSGTMIGRDRNTSDGIRHGGYYTQAQIREVVEYAASLGITIVPEIDLPGHMLAALASYPELGCAGSAPYQVATWWGISKQVLNVGREETMLFLEDVLSEVAELFPGTYIHIGGDECPRDEWKTDPDCQAKIKELGLVSDAGVSAEARLQNYVTARMQNFLALKGKKIIGWDEILEGELAEGATVMSWRGTKGGIKAAGMGYDVIMTPNTYCYFDYSQSPELDKEPFGITRDPKRAVTLRKIYDYEPFEGLSEDAAAHILGVQANMWGEYIATQEHLEYMLLPRMIALSEVQWCEPSRKDYGRFLSGLESHGLRILDLLGYNYRKPSQNL